MKIALVLNLGILSYLTATDIFTPSLPVIAMEFNSSSNDVQASISLFLVGAVISCVIGGLFSDYIGNKRLLLVGLGISLFGSVLTLFCTNLDMLLIGRFIQGLGGAMAPVVGHSLIQEHYTEDQLVRVYSWMGISLAGVPALAPALGGFISAILGWRYNFWLLFLLTLISWILIWVYIPSDQLRTAKRSLRDHFWSYVTILTNRKFLSYSSLSPFFNAGEWFYIAFLPFYFQNQLGLSTQGYGWTIGLLMIWFSAGTMLVGRFSKYFQVDTLIYIALSLGVFSSIGLFMMCAFVPYSVIGFYIFLVIYMTGFGMLFPTTVAKAMSVFRDMKTRSSSIRFLMITLFSFVGSMVAEYADDTNIWNLPIFILVLSLFSFFSFSMRGKANS